MHCSTGFAHNLSSNYTINQSEIWWVCTLLHTELRGIWQDVTEFSETVILVTGR